MSLGLSIYLVSLKVGTSGFAALLAAAGTGGALVFWYGLEMICSKRPPAAIAALPTKEPMELTTKIDHILTEARMVLPGAQALFGFQGIIFFAERFESLPPLSKSIHLISLLMVTFAIVLLMAPAAYHRIVERGEDTERLYQVSSKFVLGSMVFLAAGMSLDFYVVATKVTQHATLAAVISAGLACCFLGLWFGYTAWARRR